ncbi:unnamed protein product, partial [Closterium sp. NIES-54]
MAPHGVAVTRRLGLVLAVTALMLSACAPRAAAGRQPATSNDAASSLQQTIARLLGLISSKDKPPADPCVAKKCGANAICVKDKGAARCACNVGFSMTPTGCVAADPCALKACGVNGKCIKDSAGVASCVCNAGFLLQADKTTCS